MTVKVRVFVEVIVLTVVACLIGLSVNGIRKDGLKLFDSDCFRQFQVCSGSLEKSDYIDVDRAISFFYGKSAVFVDARPSIAYSTGHIYGALNLTVEDVKTEKINTILGLSKDSVIVVYDDGVGGGEALGVALALKSKGFEKVLVFLSGFTAWQSKGLPINYGFSP